jgi:two-component system sensor histidine kinase CpxA
MQFALSILEERVHDQNRPYVQDVKEEVELMSKLVDELLTYSKAGIKAPQVELEKVKIKPLVERAIERETAKEKAEIEIEINEDLQAQAQPELLSRAIANVVRNAVRYAANAGKIKVSAQNSNGQVKIIICDQGTGVSEGELEKIFDPLYRVESARSRQTGGTGLGLAIVKTCIEACQGKVFAENLIPTGLAVTFVLKN